MSPGQWGGRSGIEPWLMSAGSRPKLVGSLFAREQRHRIDPGSQWERTVWISCRAPDRFGNVHRQDVCSVSHSMLMANPLIRNDELQLLAKFGLEYSHPDRMTAIFFDDGTVLEFWSDLERTVASMMKISETDARNFEAFVNTVDVSLDMVIMGMFSVPPTAGMQTLGAHTAVKETGLSAQRPAAS